MKNTVIVCHHFAALDAAIFKLRQSRGLTLIDLYEKLADNGEPASSPEEVAYVKLTFANVSAVGGFIFDLGQYYAEFVADSCALESVIDQMEYEREEAAFDE